MEVVRLWVLVVTLTSLFYLFISVSAGDFTQNSSGTRRRSPVDSLCVQLIEPAGYPCTEFTIQTEDGYLLAIQRVASRIGNLRVQRGPPVLLQHGLFMAGDAWLLDSTEQSLGFILANHGFDVWLAMCMGHAGVTGIHLYQRKISDVLINLADSIPCGLQRFSNVHNREELLL